MAAKSKKKKRPDKPLIGRHEWFSIPELGINWFRGKIDTGARSSSLHATDIEPFEKEDGTTWVRFTTVDDLKCEEPVIFTKAVKNSSGIPVQRYFIEVEVETLDDEAQLVLVSLHNRTNMRCPLLMGRRELRFYLVDCSRNHILGKPVNS